MPPSPPPNRRLFSRVECRYAATVRRENSAWPCTLVDLSLNGALLETPEDFVARPGDRYRLDVPFLPGDSEGGVVSAEAVVVHARGDRVGVLFEAVDDVSLPHLRSLILLLARDPLAAP